MKDKNELNKEQTTKEVKDMSDSKDDKKESKKLTKEEKMALRRNAVEQGGRLYLADEYKEKGYVYRVCNVTPGNIERYKLHGGEIVTHKLTSGDGSLDNQEVKGNPGEFEVGGGASGSLKAVWMRFTEEDYEIMKELEREPAKAQEEMIKQGVDPQTGQSLIPQSNLIGKITKGF